MPVQRMTNYDDGEVGLDFPDSPTPFRNSCNLSEAPSVEEEDTSSK
jgi:hypothetical protein